MMAFGAKIKLSVNTSGASAFRKEIQNFVDTSTVNNPIKLKNFTVSMTAAQRKEIMRQLQEYLSSDTALTLKVNKIDATSAVNQLRSQLQTMLSGLKISGLKEFLGTDAIDDVVKGIDDAKKSANEWASQMKVINDISSKLGSTYKTALSGNQMIADTAQISEITASYTAWQQKVEELKATKVALSTDELTALQNEGIAIQQKISLIQQEHAERIKSANAERTAATEEEVAARKRITITQQQVSLKAQMQRYIMSNSKAYRAYSDELDSLMHTLQNESNLTSEDLKQIRQRFIEIQSSARAAGVSGNTFFDTLKKGWAKFGGWSLVTKSMMAAWRTIKNMVTAVRELDDAMTELKKVTELSDQAYQDYIKTASKLSQAVGATLSNTVNATADFARLGYSVSEASELAEAALVYKNVGDGIDDISEASESLISTMKAFGVTANDAMEIVDKFNEVGNNFAISSKGIGDALQNAASSLAAANNSLEESIALITGMNAVLQDPERVGTALKTVTMYLRAAKTEAEEAGESTEGMANSVSELRDELLTLTKGQVDIMIDDTTFKSTYQIMKELSEVWDDLSDVDTANILELIGGKRNATAITSLLTNFEDAEAALVSANQAAGSAAKENETYLESISGKLDILKSKFETLSTNLIDSGSVKVIIDLAAALLDVLNALQEIHLLLPLITIATIAYMGAMNANKISALTTQITLQKSAMLTNKTVSDQLALSISHLTVQQRKLLLAELDRAVASGTLTASERAQIVSTLGLAGANTTLAATNKGLAASFKTLMASIPIWGWIALGISLVIELIGWLTDLIGSIESSEEKLSRLNDEFKTTAQDISNIANEYKNLRQSADEIIPRFTELAKGVDDLGKNISLTDEEYAEFLELNNKIAEMFPELNLGFDSQGNAMLALSYSANTLSESLWELVEAEREAKNQAIADKLPDLVDNLNEQREVYDKEKDLLESRLDSYAEAKKHYDEMYSDEVINRYKEAYGDDWQYYHDTAVGSSNMGIVQYMQEAFGTFQSEEARQAWQDLVSEFEDEEGTVDWYALLNSNEMQNAIAGINKQIDDIGVKVSDTYQKISPIVSAWIQTDETYDALDSEMQSIMTKMVGNMDFASLMADDADDLKNQVREWFINPIAEATPEAQATIKNLFSTITSFNRGDMNYSEFQLAIENMIDDLEAAGFSNKFINTLTMTLNVDDLYDKADKVKSLLKDEYKDAVNNMTAEEIELAYKVEAANGSLTLDELKQEIFEMSLVGADMIEVLDFSPMTDKFEDIASSIKSITSAMDKLKEGTALTKAEVAKLALEYPELLESSNLFAEETIEGQNAVLENLLGNYESEYDATIDAKIAELKAVNECLNAQAELEARKQELLLTIKEGEVNGKIESEAWLANKIAEFNELQARNYVSMENGILTVNENALNAQMQGANEAAQENTDAWAQSASQVTNFYNASANASVQTTSIAQEKIRTKINGIGEWFKALWQTICRLFSEGKWEWGILETVWDDTEINVSMNATDKGKYNYHSVDNKELSAWVSDQETAIADRLSQIRTQYDTNLNIINNLEGLKGLDLNSLYGSSKNNGNTLGDEVDEYLADIDAYYDALKKLADAQELRENIEKELKHTDDPATKIGLYDRLVDAYKAEALAEKELVKQRSATVQANAEALRALGFEVEYNADTNQLYIKNLEHLNELTADSQGEYESLQEATNALREDTEDLINITEDLNDANRDSVDNIEDLTYTIQDASKEIIDCIEEIYEAQIDSYNDIIEKRKEAIESAKEEYDYEEDIADKVKDIAELQAKIDKLSLDNSREAQAERNSLLAELEEKQKELNNTQRDHAYDEQIEALDKMAETYEEEKKSEIELLRDSIGTVQELGDTIDDRVTNAWNNAKKAVEEYGKSVAGLSGGVVTSVDTVPKYHNGGLVGDGTMSKKEVLALLENGEVVLDDDKQDSLYEVIDFQNELSKRLGVGLGSLGLPAVALETVGDVEDVTRGIIDNSSKTVFEPHISVEISHNGDISDDDARRYGEEIADAAITKLYSAFERKGINRHSGSILKP